MAEEPSKSRRGEGPSFDFLLLMGVVLLLIVGKYVFVWVTDYGLEDRYKEEVAANIVQVQELNESRRELEAIRAELAEAIYFQTHDFREALISSLTVPDGLMESDSDRALQRFYNGVKTKTAEDYGDLPEYSSPVESVRELHFKNSPTREDLTKAQEYNSAIADELEELPSERPVLKAQSAISQERHEAAEAIEELSPRLFETLPLWLEAKPAGLHGELLSARRAFEESLSSFRESNGEDEASLELLARYSELMEIARSIELKAAAQN